MSGLCPSDVWQSVSFFAALGELFEFAAHAREAHDVPAGFPQRV